MKANFNISGNFVDVFNKKIFPAQIQIINGKINSITPVNKSYNSYILPGLIDAHLHIESSMLLPVRFAQIALKYGVVSAIADPHEIANVTGVCGIETMIKNAKASPFKFFFGVPSCVPATNFETSGNSIMPDDIRYLFSKYDNFVCLSEVMNYPDVISENPLVFEKINIAKSFNKCIDGHAPGLSGNNLIKYIQAGITTDHESVSIEEAEEKIIAGMKIIIREGSAAKNFDALYTLIDKYPDKVMICTDDCHPDDLSSGYLKNVFLKGLSYNLDLFNLLKAFCINPVLHYNLNVGLLRINDNADFIIIDNFEEFNVKKVYINGSLVYDTSKNINFHADCTPINNFNANFISENDLKVKAEKEKIQVIQAFDKNILTKRLIVNAKIINNHVVQDIDNDILKLVVLNRYKPSKPSIGFINGFGLKDGAVASTIAHDSHNIIAIGTNDNDLVTAINHLIHMQGGIVFAKNEDIFDIPLEIAGLITAINPVVLTNNYIKLNKLLADNGCTLTAPIMTLSFMALLVIPELKLSDLGLFDSQNFSFTSLFV